MYPYSSVVFQAQFSDYLDQQTTKIYSILLNIFFIFHPSVAPKPYVFENFC